MADVKNYAVGSNEALEAQVNHLAESAAYNDAVIRIMPDGHAGRGAVVGSTIRYNGKICPNTVGVDVACRVSLYKVPANIDLEKFDRAAHMVPAGFNIHENALDCPVDYNELTFWDGLDQDKRSRIMRSLGSMGGGNHACALDVASDGSAYLMVHCGSRSLGVVACEHHQAIAEHHVAEVVDGRRREVYDEVKSLAKSGRHDEIEALINRLSDEMATYDDKTLAYLEGAEMEDYLHDMRVCERWTKANHDAIYTTIANAMGWETPADDALFQTCVHNYVDVEDGIIRKGAISGEKGEIGIIPLNMRDGVLLVEALGNEDWNRSLPHGAGRQMSRSEARRNIDLDEYVETMKGVYSTTVNAGSIDEAPMAYKPWEEIAKAIKPNAVVIDHLREVYNYKDDTAR